MELFSVSCRFDIFYLDHLEAVVEEIMKDVIPLVEFKKSTITVFEIYNLKFPSTSIVQAQKILDILNIRIAEFLNIYEIKVYDHSKILTV